MNPLVCPKCGSDMRAYERNGVTIDQCTGCRGIFLDRGELEKLTDAEASYYGSRPAARPHRHRRPPRATPRTTATARRPVPRWRPRRLLQEEEEAQLPRRPVRLTGQGHVSVAGSPAEAVSGPRDELGDQRRVGLHQRDVAPTGVGAESTG